MTKIFFTWLALVFPLLSYGQLPETDAYLFKLFNNGVKVTVSNPAYISSMNPNGYNNQPAFATPNLLYLTTDLYDDTFTDLIKLDLISKEFIRITATDSISEYSPNPKATEGFLSCVRVEKDGATQTLHLYPKDHSNYGKRVLNDFDNIGYHQWLSENEVALFLVTEPVSLVIADIENETSKTVFENIGRCMRQDHDGNLIFVHKVRSDLWYLKSYNPDTQETVTLIQTLPEAEDFEILVDGTILMGSGSTLKSINPIEDEYWQEVADLYPLGIENISRIAVSRNRLVLINKK